MFIVDCLALRTLSEADVEDIATLKRELSAKTPPVTKQVLTQLLLNGAMVILREPERKRIVGMASIVFRHTLSGRLGTVEDVIILTAYRGNGAGRILMERLINHAREMCFSKLDLTSRPSRTAANALYKNLGFSRIRTNIYRITL